MGKRNCAYKLLAIGTCAKMMLQNSGETDDDASLKAYRFYKGITKGIGYAPTFDERTGTGDGMGLLQTEKYIKAHCPKELTNYALSTFEMEKFSKLSSNLDDLSKYENHIAGVEHMTLNFFIDILEKSELRDKE